MSSVASPGSAARHILTVNVEDYFQVGAFRRYIDADNWYRFESRLEENLEETLQLLSDHGASATFFVLGWTAEKHPELVRRIIAAGHEVGSRGFLHQPLTRLSRPTVRMDLARSKATIEEAAGCPVTAFRLSDGWLKSADHWLLDELVAAGYGCDSSMFPGRSDTKNGVRPYPYLHETSHGSLIEVPLSTLRWGPFRIPIAGGNYMRQCPQALMDRLVARHVESESGPFVMYFQLWELDDKQPRLSITDRITQVRHYRKLGKFRRLLPHYLSQYSFTSIRDFADSADDALQSLSRIAAANRAGAVNKWLPPDKDAQAACVKYYEAPEAVREADEPVSAEGSRPAADLDDVAVVIPCFNEEASLPYLARTIERLEFNLSSLCRPQFVFVDDCSTDNTADTLEAMFGTKTNAAIIRHEENKGVSAAILTGIAATDTQLICSMDCDCSYDPNELVRMLPLMSRDVAMVTASPYHPDGTVRNVPGWRLLLSRGLSLIYRMLLQRNLSTWTSCFRVYRRSQISDLPLREQRFLGTAEMAALLCLHDRHIVEHPTTLEVRLFGFSKMKTVRTIMSHLGLLMRMARFRFFGEPKKN